MTFILFCLCCFEKQRKQGLGLACSRPNRAALALLPSKRREKEKERRATAQFSSNSLSTEKVPLVFGESLIKKLGWDPESLVAKSPGFRRELIIPAATGTHLCLGSIFAWSIFNAPLMRLNGVLAPSAADWALNEISITFSLVMGGFAWGAIFGTLLDKYGPRVSCLIGASGLVSFCFLFFFFSSYLPMLVAYLCDMI